ncbi:uncharacterized protein LOC129599041 [Paramacrobiotus metropolitanus]|uniref:uncharacterized protein LOC129599041 n=1 Tax=Paramacrobiotus metropolitanus TaxID=2943436 RepID=UPI002445DAAD|nr:uncharacterized protein LOC129599041 [Paramacrobiotus metropolitanus]
MIPKKSSKTKRFNYISTHQHMSAHFKFWFNQENQNLKNEKEQSDLRIKRLEDENKALQMSNKHKDEQLLQHGVRAATVESPPPSYSKAHETGTGKSFHFEMPLRTGTGKRSVKNERDGEKVKDDKEPPSESYPHMSRGDPSQFPPHIETNVFVDDGRRDRPSSRQERQRKSRYEKVKRNQNDDDGSEEEDDPRAETTAAQLTKALNSMARKNTLVTFDGSRDTVNGWTRLVKETQKTYQLTDDQIMIEIASAVKGPAKTWFEGEKDIASEDGIEYSVTEWMDKFKDEYGDRDEEVLGLREAYARKFELGKESLDQYYQAMMRFKAKRIMQNQAVGFLIEGCRVDNELYKALRTQKCRTPTDVKDFFRHWATGEEKYKAPEIQRNQEYVTIRQGQVENVPQQRMAAAPVQQPVEYRVETPVREVTEKVTFIDSQTGQPITYAMVAAIQAAAQVRPVPQNVAPPVPQNVAPPNVGLPQQGVGNGNFSGNGYGNGNWNGGQGNFQNQGQGQGYIQPNRGNQNYLQNQGSRTEFKFQKIDGWVANGVQMCQYCMYGNHQTQGCKFVKTHHRNRIRICLPSESGNAFALRAAGVKRWQMDMI